MASEQYPERIYSVEDMYSIETARSKADAELKGRGYTGSYPVYTKEKQTIHVVEEHPFTILEWKHYKFRIHFMISEGKTASNHQLNSGFFKGVGRKGWIETYDYKS